VPARLERIRPPTLVIFGRTTNGGASFSTELYRPVPGVQVKLLPGVGHTPMIEDPAATARLLSDFADQYLAQRSQLAPEVRIQPGSDQVNSLE
jgi:pimeloyl-ACP methyl ester carboxylesterase